MGGAKSVGSVSSVCKASSAFSTILRRRAFSAFESKSEFPIGLTILAAGITRLDPTMSATGVIVHTCEVGIPARSNSLLSAAPQRVLVPQVEVRITPDTSLALSSSAMARPIFFTFSTTVATPAVL